MYGLYIDYLHQSRLCLQSGAPRRIVFKDNVFHELLFTEKTTLCDHISFNFLSFFHLSCVSLETCSCICSWLHACLCAQIRVVTVFLTPHRWRRWARLCGWRCSASSCSYSSAGLQHAALARRTRCPRPTSNVSCTASWSSWALLGPGWSIPRIRLPTSSDLRVYRVRCGQFSGFKGLPHF